MLEERLKLVRELSRSGVATVWEAWDNSLDRKVLVKSIHPQFARDADLRIRFEREARAIARLSHPNVVQIYDIQSDEDALSLLLEFVEGETLGSLLKRRGALPFSIALRITTDVLAGLEQAHAQGIIHRDLKPDNILIARTGVVKITDFGLASLQDLPGVTMEGAVVGTPSYMAPEQALGGETSAQTDLFTCGAVFFEMLTGQRLIPGESLGEAFQSVMKYRSPDLTVLGSVIPPAVRPLMDALLERDPTRRPESAGEARRRLFVQSPEPPADQSALISFMAGTDWTRPANEILLKAGRHSRYWAFIGAGALVLILAGIWALTFRSSQMITERPPISVSQDTAVAGKVSTPDSISSPPQDPTREEPRPEFRAIPVETTIAKPPKPVVTEAARPAFATITSNPWARVFYGDSLLGTTPLAAPIELPSGRGTFLFLNDEIGLPVSQQLELKAGDTLHISVRLHDYLGRVRVVSVQPWADVYVDGQFIFKTPSSRVLFLPLGKHSLELRHPTLPTYQTDIVFEPRDPVFEVRVDLTQL
ncbi:protein kinase [bacterium]|nr:protein kinase [bacterium]